MRRQLSFFINFGHWFHWARGHRGSILSVALAAREQTLHRATAEGEVRKEPPA